MTESLIAPEQTSQGTEDNCAERPSAEHAADGAAARIYQGSEALAGDTDRAEKDPTAEEGTAAPVSYEAFALPDGVAIDESALGEAQSLFSEAKLSQPQAQKFVDLYAGKINDLIQRQVVAAQDRQKAWVAEVKNDPELGGRQFESARAAAQKAIKRFGSPELGRTLDELWVGNNPQLFRFFVRVGQAFSEDRYAGARSGVSRLSAAETLYPYNKE